MKKCPTRACCFTRMVAIISFWLGSSEQPVVVISTKSDWTAVSKPAVQVPTHAGRAWEPLAGDEVNSHWLPVVGAKATAPGIPEPAAHPEAVHARYILALFTLTAIPRPNPGGLEVA